MDRMARGAPAAALCAATFAAMSAPAADEHDAADEVPTLEQQADAAQPTRFFDDMLRSSTLRLPVMAGRMPDSTVDFGRTRTPVDELAESARRSTDPMVSSMWYEYSTMVHGRSLRPFPME